jgi:hypothetical protein
MREAQGLQQHISDADEVQIATLEVADGTKSFIPRASY